MADTLTRSTKAKIQGAAGNTLRATGLTHPLYRYPASMSPGLARELILSFTRLGDTVLDPFCGGGTTAIESLSNGRKIVCSDLNSLASFVTLTKGWPLREGFLPRLEEWFLKSIERLRKSEGVSAIPLLTRSRKEYSPKTHGMLLSLRDLAYKIPEASTRRVALLITLQVGKLCFDCRELPPSPWVLIRKLESAYHKAIASIMRYSLECYKWDLRHNMSERFKIYNCSIHDLPQKLNSYKGRVKLVLTSPPYPGIHVLYNRWQIHGRGETDLPYTLLGLRDGHPASVYTLGDRKEVENKTYFTQMESGFQGLRDALERSTIIAQVISFPDPKRQLPQYMELMARAGYKELFLDKTHRAVMRREIPNRRWYATRSDGATPAREYVIIHRLK